MSLATSLNATADKLIEQYGNTVIIESNLSSGGYDPQTGEFSINTSTHYTCKAVSTTATIDALKVSGLDETSFGLVKRVYTIPYSLLYADINNEWNIDGYTVRKVIIKEAQDVKITIQLFVG
jgi:hypothetical protein